MILIPPWSNLYPIMRALSCLSRMHLSCPPLVCLAYTCAFCLVLPLCILRTLVPSVSSFPCLSCVHSCHLSCPSLVCLAYSCAIYLVLPLCVLRTLVPSIFSFPCVSCVHLLGACEAHPSASACALRLAIRSLGLSSPEQNA